MKHSKIASIIICALTFLTALTNLIIKIYDRKQVITALKEENLVTLLKLKQKTKIL